MAKAILVLLVWVGTPLAQQEESWNPRISCSCPCTHRFQNNNASPMEFYAIGWSRSGKFARIKETFALDEREFTFVIQDMVTDEVLVEYFSNEFYMYADSMKISDLALQAKDFWDYEEKRIQGLMREHKIIRKRAHLLNFPVETETDTLTVVLQRTFRPSVGDEIIDSDSVLVDFSVEIVSRNRGTKRVYFAEVEDFERVYGLDISVCGYVKNPNEERIAILLSKRHHHPYTGDWVDVLFIGAHLKVGW